MNFRLGDENGLYGCFIGTNRELAVQECLCPFFGLRMGTGMTDRLFGGA